MENEWDSSNFGMEFHYEEQQMASCFFNPVDQVDPFESALSSIVSSPARGEIQNDGIVLRELIGKLGSICNSGEVSPQSPPKLNVSATEMNQSLSSFLIQGNSLSNLPAFSPFSADPGFIERAARSSCFGNGNIKGLSGEFRLNETELRCRSAARVGCGKLSRVSSKQSLKSGGSQIGAYESKVALSRSATPENGEFGDSKEVSSVSEQISADANPRKRKSTSRGMAKDAILFPLVKKAKATTKIDEMNTKSNSADEAIGTHKGNFEEQLESNVNQKETPKPPEPPTDYIHVRARRGQATDSHSLAERVRREKISERMKFLQDLVPGCNKVTGKAVMLDEIINYVQSLQRQVEFLSMKLAFLNPNMEVEALLSKDISQSHVALPQNILPLDSPASGLSFGFESQWPIQQGVTPNELENIFSAYSLDTTLHRNSGTQSPPTNALRQYASQPCSFWEYDLQSVAQTGFDENQTQSLRGSVEAIHMKIEL